MGTTFQAFRGSSRAQTAFTILLATSIGDRVTQCTAHERWVTNAVTVGQNHFFLENKVVLNFDFRHRAKNQVISTTRCKELAKCISIYFDILGYLWPTTGTERNAKTPSKKGLIQKM